ncbi:hypothetical protein HXX76_010029 [Chlamydomonas incerta]|uniref:Uncharacterized protein n=1 Tax=Chlamydomonas incerta TaxID=51695 RepID=A0A835T2R5_CHLIN|nr:hypothetical protein HXX76_010029 [Chlamydomonas incerta]|eukprot:KAG2430506.1 hypothetical protein HXX76_010029 [Chlamydomonas incerta]
MARNLNSTAGGTVTFEPGRTYLLGSLRLSGSVHLVVPPGTLLQASAERSSYGGAQNTWYLLYFLGCRNCSVSGGGTVRGCADAFMPPQQPPPPRSPAADGQSQGGAGMGGPEHVEDTSGVDVSNWADPSCRVWRQCRPRLVGLIGCEHVSLSDVALADSAFWTLHVRRSRHVDLSGLRVSGNMRFPNNDGIDIDGSAHVTIRNCTVSTADDALCLKTTLGLGERDPDPGLRALEAAAAKAAKVAAHCSRRGHGHGSSGSSAEASSHTRSSSSSSSRSTNSSDGAACGEAVRLPPPRATEHVLVEGCVLSSRSAAVKLGSESRADMSNITFRGVRVLDSNRGLGIQLRDWGNIRHVTFEDVSVATSRVSAGRWWGGGEPIYVSALPRHVDGWGRVGQLCNVTFRRVAATATGGLVVVAGSPESVVRGVTLEDVTLRILPPLHQAPAIAAAATTAAAAAASGVPAAVQGPRRAQEATGDGAGGRGQDAVLLGTAGVQATAPAAGRRLLGAAGQGPDNTASGTAAGAGATASAAGGSTIPGEGTPGGDEDAAEATDWPLGVKLDLRPGPYDVRRWPLAAAGPVLVQYVQGLTLRNVDIQLVAPAPGRAGPALADGGGTPWSSPPPPRSWLAGWLDWWLVRPPPWCVELVGRTVHGLQAQGVRIRAVPADEASGALPAGTAAAAAHY